MVRVLVLVLGDRNSNSNDGIDRFGMKGMNMKPEEMEAAMIRNLLEKTGKSLEEWCEVLRDSGLTEKREMKKHLKEDHGVGHFQTQTIVKHYLKD